MEINSATCSVCSISPISVHIWDKADSWPLIQAVERSILKIVSLSQHWLEYSTTHCCLTIDYPRYKHAVARAVRFHGIIVIPQYWNEAILVSPRFLCNDYITILILSRFSPILMIMTAFLSLYGSYNAQHLVTTWN